MMRALSDPIAVRGRYTLDDLGAALSIAYGRFLLRPDAAYRIELLRRTLIGLEEAERSVPAAVFGKLSRKVGLTR
jgi:hypothetical protein